MQTTWTQAGREYTTTPEQQARVSREIATLEWHDATEGLSMPMMQGYAIRTIARETRGTLVRVAYNGALGPCGFYGVEKQYSDGTAKNFYVDDGTSLTAVRSDFTPTEVPAHA